MANQSNQLRLPAVGAKFPDLVPRIGGIKQAESANWVNFLLFIGFALARRNPTGAATSGDLQELGSCINPILHKWFRNSCFTCDGSSTIQDFSLHLT
jgi:hypothetical protein